MEVFPYNTSVTLYDMLAILVSEERLHDLWLFVSVFLFGGRGEHVCIAKGSQQLIERETATKMEL